MRRSCAAALLALLLALSVQRPVDAWGFAAHKFIADRAIGLLPPEIRPFFEHYRVSIVEHAIDPDTYRTVGWTEEPPRHFLDMDAYGPFPFTVIPHDHDAAVARFGADFVVKNGTLPWRTEEMYERLRGSFGQLSTAPYARDDVKLFSSVLAHYVADAHQPFHAARNYDGQLTGQVGIHARFETELFERYQDRLRVAPGPVVRVPNARDFTFATLTDSYSYVDRLLAADREAVAGRDEYDDAYFEALFAKTRGILEERISRSITDVASVITAAWIEAGRPALPPEAPPRAPRKVRRDPR